MRALGVAFLLAIGLVACGDDGPREFNPFDTCSLLTTDEIGEAVGKPVGDGRQGDQPPSYLCDWLSEDSDGAALEVIAGDATYREDYFNEHSSLTEFEIDGHRAHFDLFLGAEAITDDYVVGLVLFSADLDAHVIEERAVALLELVLERVER